MRDKTAQDEVNELLKLRGVIGQAIEKARQEKLIGNALEAAVTLHCDTITISDVSHEELEEFFILSDLKLESANGTVRHHRPDRIQKMRALLASSFFCRNKRGPS